MQYSGDLIAQLLQLQSCQGVVKLPSLWNTLALKVHLKSRHSMAQRPKLHKIHKAKCISGGHLEDAQLFQQGHEATPRIRDIKI